MGRKMLWAAVAWMVVGQSVLAEEPARPREKLLDLPAVWAAVPADVRMGAELVAEKDADRLLVERIYGLRVDADIRVIDLALANADFQGIFQQEIKGIRMRGKPEYKDDLSVEVVREVTIREVIETIQRTLRRTKDILGVREERIESIAREAKDTVLAVMGNGAVPGSLGHKKILAKRAAELDAYRQLAEQVAGIRISGQTYVRNFVVVNDTIATQLAAVLKGARTTDIAYNQDGSCEVTMTLTLREVIETIERSYKRQVQGIKVTEQEWRKVSTENQDKTITATGKGAPRPEGAGAPVGVGAPQPFLEETRIIKRVISREIGAQ